MIATLHGSEISIEKLFSSQECCLWLTFWNDFETRHQTQERGKYYSGAKFCVRTSRTRQLYNGNHHGYETSKCSHLGPPEAKQRFWSYVYNEVPVPGEENEESGERLNFDMSVGIFCGTSKQICNANLGVSTYQSVLAKYETGSRRNKGALELRLSMFRRFTRPSGNQIQPEGKSI